MKNPDNWDIRETSTLFKDAHLEVFREEVIPPGEHRLRRWTVVRRKQAVVIAPITDDGKIVLICQERIPIRQAIWEMPSGPIDCTTPSMKFIFGEPMNPATKRFAGA